MLDWTGERFIPGVKGDIEIEHLHRYHAVAELVKGLRVLDIACGEGYGSNILAQRATSVVGVDISAESVAHARATYAVANVHFENGSCTSIPLPDASIDAIVSFETLEHVAEHEATLREYTRVLAPGGWLCISCPDKLEYSDLPHSKNEFHKRELYLNEFHDLLKRHFKNVLLYGQRVQYSSVIGPLGRDTASFHAYRSDDTGPVRSIGLLRPVYFVGVASNRACPELPSGSFEPDVPPHVHDLRVLTEQLAQLRAVHEGAVSEAHEASTQSERIKQELEHTRREQLELQTRFEHSQHGELALRSELETALKDDERARSELHRVTGELHRVTDELSGRASAFAIARQQKEAEFSDLKREKAQQETARIELSAQLLAVDSDLRATRHALQQWEHRANQMQATVTALRSSRSWSVTRPLRWIGETARNVSGIVSNLRGVLSKVAHFAYRRAPLSAATKRRTMDLFFTHFPSLFESTITYRRWQFLRTENVALASLGFDEAVSPAAEAAQIPPLERSPSVTALLEVLPIADGRWEWADYSMVRERVLRAEQGQRLAVQPVPIPILDYSDAELDHAIAALRFLPSTRPLVSIIVPVYNKLKYTVECLVSIARSAPQVEYEIIVADDASTDGSANRLATVPNLRVSTGIENLHFLRNVNRVLPLTRGRFVLLLNNDVQVQSGWLDHLVAAALTHPDIGAVGPKIIHPSGHLQEAGCSFRPDSTSEMVGLNQRPDLPQFNYTREVDYCSGACLLVDAAAFQEMGGFDETFTPAYCEDSDLCLQLRERGLRVLYVPAAVVVHHLSKTTAELNSNAKMALIGRNLDRFAKKWQGTIDTMTDVRLIAFYLPQFHPVPENDRWWGKGFTEWSNVGKAMPNFVGHYQPRIPSDLGYYDLRVPEVMEQQVELARRYGIGGFCFYYYWFAGRRLLEMPVDRMLQTGRPDFPFCLCWANENWTRRWDGQDEEILMAQAHSNADDVAVIMDLIRYMRHPNYIRINGRPLLVVYRVTLFPDFASTAATWRRVCREQGLGEIYLSLVESFEMVFNTTDPAAYGGDATVEFPPQGMADPRPPSGAMINTEYNGQVADYRDLAVRYCLRDQTPYVRFRGLMPGWDNTARRQNTSFCFERATPGAFQAWAEHIIDQTRSMRSGDERIVFINAWNEWAEGAYLEPDRRFGHTFLQAVRNARDAALLKRRGSYALE